MPAPYSTIDDAATAALLLALNQPDAHRREYMGGIYPVEGGYAFTEPQGHRRTKGQASIPANSVALYHNHPVGRGNDRFSPHDVETANQLRLLSYIAAPRTDENPLLTQLRKYRGGSQRLSGHAAGEPVLSTIPIETILEAIARRNPLMAAYLAERVPAPHVAFSPAEAHRAAPRRSKTDTP